MNGLLALLACVAPIPNPAIQVNRVHEFVYTADSSVKSVSVAGTFNKWDKSADPLTPVPGKPGVWSIKLELPVGRHSYKFVINGDQWIVDPKAPSEVDGGGNRNSILVVLPKGYEEPAHLGDGLITPALIDHGQSAPTLRFDQGKLTVGLRVRPDDIQKVVLVTKDNQITLHRAFGDEFTETRQATLSWDGKTPLDYNFRLYDGLEIWTYDKRGVTDGPPADLSNDFELTSTTIKAPVVPTWPQNAVFYQIFPDRFANGDQSNDPAGVEPWGSKPTYTNFLGGDLQGVDQKLGYLKNLGITALYLNPIFDGPANHGYLTTDYTKVAPHFGGSKGLVKLSEDLHAQGMKIVLDGVFNHSSVEFAPFQDLVKNQQQSPYKDWYHVKSWPVVLGNTKTYEGWAGYANLPKLNTANPAVQSYFQKIVDGWEEAANIDGWRLDVADKVDPAFWRAFRTNLKSRDSQTWICGENWTDSSAWLQGDQWDSTMDYPFRGALLTSIAQNQGTAQQFLDGLFASYAMYQPALSRNMLHFLGTHDTPRWLNQCGEDQARANLGAIVLLTWPGTPCIYFGDEIGMTGGQDPDNRRAMEWDKATPANPDLQLYTKLVHARLGSEALKTGAPVPVLADDKADLAVYGRLSSDDAALVAINRSNQSATTTISLSGGLATLLAQKTLTDALTGEQVKVGPQGEFSLTVPAKSGAVLLPRPPKGNFLALVKHESKTSQKVNLQ